MGSRRGPWSQMPRGLGMLLEKGKTITVVPRDSSASELVKPVLVDWWERKFQHSAPTQHSGTHHTRRNFSESRCHPGQEKTLHPSSLARHPSEWVNGEYGGTQALQTGRASRRMEAPLGRPKRALQLNDGFQSKTPGAMCTRGGGTAWRGVVSGMGQAGRDLEALAHEKEWRGRLIGTPAKRHSRGSREGGWKRQDRRHGWDFSNSSTGQRMQKGNVLWFVWVNATHLNAAVWIPPRAIHTSRKAELAPSWDRLRGTDCSQWLDTWSWHWTDLQKELSPRISY